MTRSAAQPIPDVLGAREVAGRRRAQLLQGRARAVEGAERPASAEQRLSIADVQQLRANPSAGTRVVLAAKFGRPIVKFQLVQDLLVRMLSNITASATLCARLSQLQDAGRMTDEQASMAKAFSTVRMRETVGWARELMGGNGILLEYDVGRYVADAEAIYSYEGTREVNTLIVGRAITGTGAIV